MTSYIGSPPPFGDIQSASSGSGYSLSVSGGDKDRLMGKDAYQFGDFPEWMSQGAPVGGLKQYKGQLNDFYNFDPIRSSYDQMAQMQRSSMGASTAAAANAATNRAMLSGGRVGSSFAQASAMLPLMRQQASQNLELGALQAQMMNQKSNAALQAASQIAGLRQQTRGMRQNYAVDAARMAQKNIGMSQNNTNQLGFGGFGSGGGQGGGGYGNGGIPQMTPGYIGNAGSAPTFSTVNGQSVPGHVFMPGAIPRLGGQVA